MWVSRWVERRLREIRDEGRQAPTRIADACKRGNGFIQKLKTAEETLFEAASSSHGHGREMTHKSLEDAQLEEMDLPKKN